MRNSKSNQNGTSKRQDFMTTKHDNSTFIHRSIATCLPSIVLACLCMLFLVCANQVHAAQDELGARQAKTVLSETSRFSLPRHDANRFQEEWIPRVIEFRDGTLIEVEIKNQRVDWKTITKSGEIKPVSYRVSELDRLDLVIKPITEEISHVRTLIAKLGSPNFSDRTNAHQTLIEIGDEYREIISAAEKTADAESQWRIRDILKYLTASNQALGNDFDRLVDSNSPDKTVDGDAGEMKLVARFRDTEFTIDRTTVLNIRVDELKLDFDGESTVAEVEQISAPGLANYPSNVRILDFDFGPSGGLLVAGQDVTNVYVPFGVQITTDVEGSYIAVQDYPVQQNTKLSAANFEPSYQGTTTFRFCVPGNPNLPASVTHIGCWVSYISPHGTQLQAFDARGEMVGMVETTVSGAEYLSLRSSVPIAFCRLMPVKDVDPDYAFDEFIFDYPKALTEAGDPDFNSIVTTKGERVQASGMTINEDGSIKLSDLTFGIKELTIAKDNIAVVVPKLDTTKIQPADARPFIQFVDGSVMRAERRNDSLSIARTSGEKPIDLNQLAGLWSPKVSLRRPNKKSIAEGAAIVIDQIREREVENVSLGKNWIESPSLPEDLAYEYSDGPVVWFQLPTSRSSDSGALRTSWGEDYTLSADSFQITKWSKDAIEIQRSDLTLVIPIYDIRSLRLPTKNQ